MKLTLMTYNIERGFHSRDHHLEEHRLLAAQRAVREVNPDLLAITEACYGRENSKGILMDYQRIFDFPYFHFAGYQHFGPNRGDEGGNCLLSRLPMSAITFPLAYKSAVRAKITLEEQVLTVDVVHPSYKVSDAQKISTLAPLFLTRPALYLLTGDFNTINPQDQIDFSLLAQELRRSIPKEAEAVVERWREASLVPWLTKRGLRDAFPPEARESTVPTTSAYGHKMEGARIDFFFVSTPVKVNETFVLKNADTEIASDHYPIVGKFEI